MSQEPGKVRALSYSGFTLVELLVVVGLIAALVAILTPTLAGAKRSADSTACASNLRQVYLAQHLYAADHQGRFAGITSSGDERWERRIARYIAADPLKPEESRLLQCPSATDPRPGSNNISSYGLNSWVMMPAWRMRTDRKMPASKIIFAGDKSLQADDFLTTDDGWFLVHPSSDFGRQFRSISHSSRSTYRHARDNLANMIMADGHVTTFRPGSLGRTSGHWFWSDVSSIPERQIDQGNCCP